jgi:3-deoxy-D-manno-octulosonate 8-phosphate phosphatase (KDO 8-P phosphatase)
MDIKLLVLDVDGTLTDGKIHISENGEFFKSFNTKDGFAIKHMLPKVGIVPVIITGRESKIVTMRARELDVTEVYQNVSDKSTILRELVVKYHCAMSQIAYIGDDLNDYAAMQLCGFKGCPADAVEQIRCICDYVAVKNGGTGAVRDICEQFLKQQDKWEDFLSVFNID